ncbi:MAG: hypothetical protein ACN6NK_03690, partial [Acinetobacter pseudolwoffii]
TYDPLVPNQVHYQAVLCSDSSQLSYRTSFGTVCILGVTPGDVNTYLKKKPKKRAKRLFIKRFRHFLYKF